MIRQLICLIAMSVGLSACAFNIHADIDGLNSDQPVFHPFMVGDEAPFTFSEAVEVGNLIFVSGMIGNMPGALDPESGAPEIAPGGVGPETLQALENIEAILVKVGADRHDIVKCTVFMADMAEWSAMNEVFRDYFVEDFPAKSAFGVTALAFNARLEIECIAARPGQEHYDEE